MISLIKKSPFALVAVVAAILVASAGARFQSDGDEQPPCSTFCRALAFFNEDSQADKQSGKTQLVADRAQECAACEACPTGRVQLAAFVKNAALDDAPKADEEGWITIFDGKTLEGWKASEHPENWTVEEGCIVGRGGRSHLFYMAREFDNLEFKSDVMINHLGNSGMYFRTAFGPGFPKGYEAQVNSSHPDPKRTGSLYNFVDVREKLVADDTWWTQHIIADGNHIIIKVNDKVVVDFVDQKDTFKKGYIALQQHNLGSEVRYKNMKVKPLPASAN